MTVAGAPRVRERGRHLPVGRAGGGRERQVALSFVVTCNAVDVVPAGSVPAGRGADTTGATMSGPACVIGVAMSVWISARTRARL